MSDEELVEVVTASGQVFRPPLGDDLLATALHESGHAVARYHFGCRVREIFALDSAIGQVTVLSPPGFDPFETAICCLAGTGGGAAARRQRRLARAGRRLDGDAGARRRRRARLR